MVRKIFFAASFLLLGLVLSAQDLSTSDQKSEIASLTELYQLDMDQKEKVATIVKKRASDIAAIVSDQTLDKHTKSRKVDAIRAGAQGSILLLLNEDQRQVLFANKMEEVKKERLEKVKNH